MSSILYEPPPFGIIGVGHLGRALLEGVIGYTSHRVKCSNPTHINFTKPSLCRVKVIQDNRELSEQVEVLLLAVRPQDMDDVLEDIKDFRGLVISFAAGLPLSYYTPRVREATVVRAMTNLAVAYGQGMTAWVCEEGSCEEKLWMAKALFSDLGNVIQVTPKDEHHLDVITSLSGSGIAYLAQVFETMKGVGIKHGLSPKDAEITVLETVAGVLTLYQNTDLTLEEIVSSVASKGGTTEAGLKTMQRRGLERALKEGLEDTISKCEDLSKR